MAENQLARAVVERLYETGEWSDFKIVTPTRTFDVHKSIIGAASPFFRSACQSGWREAESGTIHLPEQEDVVDAILRQCYGIFDVEDVYCSCEGINGCPTIECARKYLEIVIAADKYSLPHLKEDLVKQPNWSTAIDMNMQDTCVDLAAWAYEEDRRIALGPEIMIALVENVACEMPGLLTDSLDQWEKLSKHPELLKDAMRLVAQETQSLFHQPDDWKEPEYLRKKEPVKKGSQKAS